MKLFSAKTVLEVEAAIFVNLTSGWLGILLITPALLKTSLEAYLGLLTTYIPFVILGMLASLIIIEQSKKL